MAGSGAIIWAQIMVVVMLRRQPYCTTNMAAVRDPLLIDSVVMEKCCRFSAVCKHCHMDVEWSSAAGYQLVESWSRAGCLLVQCCWLSAGRELV